MLICHLLQEEVGHGYFQHCVNFQLCLTSSVGVAPSFLILGHKKGVRRNGFYTHAARFNSESRAEEEPPGACCVVCEAAYLQAKVLACWSALLLEKPWPRWAGPPLHRQGRVGEEAVTSGFLVIPAHNTLKYSRADPRIHCAGV